MCIGMPVCSVHGHLAEIKDSLFPIALMVRIGAVLTTGEVIGNTADSVEVDVPMFGTGATLPQETTAGVLIQIHISVYSQYINVR